MRCIVLCGATVPFDRLVLSIDETLARVLAEQGFDSVEVQYGHARAAFEQSGAKARNVVGFDFDPEIRARIAPAQLVITHAGSGSILDAVERGAGPARRRVIVVVNDALMDNHQIELAQKLAQLNCVVVCRDVADLPALVRDRRPLNKLAPRVSLQPFVDQLLN